MPLSIPPELKPITPFVRRAEELDKDTSRPESRLVAYYCRQFAVHTGIPLASSSPAAKVCLGELLNALEQEKAAIGDAFTRQEAEYLCRQFAYQVFDKADQEDRNGAATKTTAKTFYTSASFLQMLQQFYDTSSEEEGDGAELKEEAKEDKKRSLYAKWKATEILKAIKEGRTPQAGGYGEEGHMPTLDEDEDDNDKDTTEKKEDAPTTTTTTVTEEEGPHDELPAPAPVVPPSQPKVETVFAEDDDDEEEEEQGTEVTLDKSHSNPLPPPPAYPGPPPKPFAEDTAAEDDLPPKPLHKPLPKPAAAPKKKTGWFGGNKKSAAHASKAQLADAAELTKFALAALEDKDAELAAERLQQALDALSS